MAVGRRHFVLGVRVLDAEVVDHARAHDPGVAGDVGIARHAEVEAVGRMNATAGGDDRAVLDLLRDAAEETLRRRDLVVDLGGVRPAILIAEERAFVLRESAAGVDREELVLVGVFDRAEEVRAVAHDRPAERAAVLPAAVIGTLGFEHRSRRQRLVAEEVEGRAVKVVGARSGHHGQQAAGRQAVLRLVGGLRHLEFANRVHREVLPRLAHLRPGVVHAVDDEAVGVLAGAGADVDVAAIEKAADVVLRNARREHRQVDPPARRHRQVLNLLVGHRCRDGRRGRIDQRRFARHGDRLGERRRLEREVDDDRLIDDQREVLAGFGREALQFGRHGVAARRQRGQAELTRRLADCRPRQAGLLVAGRHGRSRKDAAARVLERAGNLGVLGERRPAGEEHQHHRRQHSHHLWHGRPPRTAGLKPRSTYLTCSAGLQSRDRDLVPRSGTFIPGDWLH